MGGTTSLAKKMMQERRKWLRVELMAYLSLDVEKGGLYPDE